MALLSWQRSIEQIVLTTKGARLLGFTSVRRSTGVSLLCRQVAKASSDAGFKTLLVMLSESQGRGGRGNASKAAAASLRSYIVPSLNGYDLLPGRDGDARPLDFNAVRLREVLQTELTDYDRIICDLPPVSDETGDGLSAGTTAGMCDSVLLVCCIGEDRWGQVSEAAALLRRVGANVSGVVSNEYKRVNPWRGLGWTGLVPASR